MGLITRNESHYFAKGVIGNVRKAQEDSHGMRLDTVNGDLFVVCDGMGGHVGGAKASSLAVESIIDFVSQRRYENPLECLNDALQFANTQILGYASDHPEYRGMGTTACLLLLRGDDAWIAHVGDSRIYLYLAREGRLHRITKDHSYVQTLVDAGEISDEEAEHHPHKNRITKALGIREDLHPSFNCGGRPIHPKTGDIFMICSDGLSGMIPDRTIERTLGEKMSLHEKGERLILLAMLGETVTPGGQDNCTVELVEIDNSPWGEREFHSYNPARIIRNDEEPRTPGVIEPANNSISPDKDKPPKSNRKRGKAWWVAVVLAAVVAVAAVWRGESPRIAERRLARAERQLATDSTLWRQYDSVAQASKEKCTAIERQLGQAEQEAVRESLEDLLEASYEVYRAASLKAAKQQDKMERANAEATKLRMKADKSKGSKKEAKR